MKQGTRVKITKLAPSENPEFRTAEWKEYKPGEFNRNVSIPVEYWLEGMLTHDIQEGECICVLRDTRNGIKVDGYFQSSYLKSWDGETAITNNSIYKIEDLSKN